MRRIIKSKVPEFWASFCRRNPRIRYGDLDNTTEGRAVRSQLHDALIEEQMGICCYCCKSILKKQSHNEHIIPQDRHSAGETMDYYNLVASCTNKNTCGHIKANEQNLQRFVSPLDEDCEEHFGFTLAGSVEGTTDKGRFTVELLNLNCYELNEARKALYDQCVMMAELCGKEYVETEYLRPKDGKLHAFADMIQYFFDRGFFDSEAVGC